MLIGAFLAHLQEDRRNSVATRNQRLAAISSFATWMQTEDPARMACWQDILAIPLLAELGWDVNARARTDFPMEQQWETALHEAAEAGEIDAARMLIDLGADPGIRDARFHATPLGWAEHFGQQALADYPARSPPHSSRTRSRRPTTSRRADQDFRTTASPAGRLGGRWSNLESGTTTLVPARTANADSRAQELTLA